MTPRNEKNFKLNVPDDEIDYEPEEIESLIDKTPEELWLSYIDVMNQTFSLIRTKQTTTEYANLDERRKALHEQLWKYYEDKIEKARYDRLYTLTINLDRLVGLYLPITIPLKFFARHIATFCDSEEGKDFLVGENGRLVTKFGTIQAY